MVGLSATAWLVCILLVMNQQLLASAIAISYDPTTIWGAVLLSLWGSIRLEHSMAKHTYAMMR